MEQKLYDVVIVGGGAAGLMAAWELVQVNKSVAILEAKERVGGRIHTLEDGGFSMPIELGAEFVHGKLKLTRWLLDKAGIKYYKVNGTMWRKEESGLEEESDFIEDYNYLSGKFRELKHDIPVSEFLDTYLKEPKYEDLKHSLRTYVEGYYAADVHRASTYAMRYELENSDEEQYRIEGGYHTLVRFLTKELENHGCTTFLSTPAHRIQWRKDNVEVETSRGKILARKLLVTVPLGVLQSDKLIFQPAIPEKIEAAKALGFGAAIKVFLQFEKVFWKETTTNGNDLDDLGFIFSDEIIPTWWTQYPKEVALLTGWLGGPHAEKLKNNTEEDILQKALASLSVIFSIKVEILKQTLKNWTVSSWAADPYCCGGYSYDVVNGEAQKQLLKQPIEQTIFFAGEALHEGIEVGTVEAALVNGREMSHQIIATF